MDFGKVRAANTVVDLPDVSPPRVISRLAFLEEHEVSDTSLEQSKLQETHERIIWTVFNSEFSNQVIDDAKYRSNPSPLNR